jgi:hypothetical protein
MLCTNGTSLFELVSRNVLIKFSFLLCQGEPPSQELELEWQRSNELEQRRKTERKIRDEVCYY